MATAVFAVEGCLQYKRKTSTSTFEYLNEDFAWRGKCSFNE